MRNAQKVAALEIIIDLPIGFPINNIISLSSIQIYAKKVVLKNFMARKLYEVHLEYIYIIRIARRFQSRASKLFGQSAMDLFEGKRETSVLLKAINTLHEGQDGLMNLGKLIGSVVSQPRVCPHPLMQSSIFSQDCLPHVV